MWDKLDEAMVEIQNGVAALHVLDVSEHSSTSKALHDAKVRARAFAECIAIFMPPHFTTADDVAREAKMRYNAKQAGDEHQTAGLGQRRYEGAEEWTKAQGGWTSDPAQGMRGTGTSKRSTPKTTQIPPSLGEKEQAAIKFAFESGMFTEAVLSTTYKVPVQVIRQIVSPV